MSNLVTIINCGEDYNCALEIKTWKNVYVVVAETAATVAVIVLAAVAIILILWIVIIWTT